MIRVGDHWFETDDDGPVIVHAIDESGFHTHDEIRMRVQIEADWVDELVACVPPDQQQTVEVSTEMIR